MFSPSNGSNDMGSTPSGTDSRPEWHGTYDEEWALLMAIEANSPEKPVSVNRGMFAIRPPSCEQIYTPLLSAYCAMESGFTCVTSRVLAC